MFQPKRFFFLFLLGTLVVVGCWLEPQQPASTESASSAAGGRDYLMCFWNAENLFDDKNDGRTGQGDKEYDVWLAQRPEVLQQKLGKLSEALLKMNNGKGPDIIALAEVESVRAAELLTGALNAQIPDRAWDYKHILMKEVNIGRHIAPVIITRLPVVQDRTRNYGNRFRIIEGHINVNNRELVVLAAHWTSRLKPENEKGRCEYADKIYGACNAMYKSNPNVDFIVCGDFNDTPQDKSVAQHLHGSGDFAAVKSGAELKLLNLMADKDPLVFGTHNHASKWTIFDQVLVSPGMLDQVGWECDYASIQTVNTLYKPGDKNKRPWRFGGQKDSGPRGYSDHFPVTVRLTVH